MMLVNIILGCTQIQRRIQTNDSNVAKSRGRLLSEITEEDQHSHALRGKTLDRERMQFSQKLMRTTRISLQHKHGRSQDFLTTEDDDARAVRFIVEITFNVV